MIAENEAAVARHFHERSKILVTLQSHHLLDIRIEMQAVADGEFDFRIFARGDHRIAVGDGGGQRLFGDDVLAGLGHLNHEITAHAGRGHDIDDVNVLVVSNAIHVFVAV